jgi:mono/diheme cytochrome c family protein
MLTNVRSVMMMGFAALCLTGCGQEMAEQPSYRPLRPSAFFADGRSERPLIAGTVARGHLNGDVQMYTGKLPRESRDLLQVGGTLGTAAGNPLGAIAWSFERPLYADTFPMPITLPVLKRGQERFDIYCAVCHDRMGTGRGMIVQRGFTQPPSYHTDYSRGLALQGIRVKLRDAPVGYYFGVITHGFGAMPDYSEQVPVPDRWAIIAYIRALQMSQHATLADVHDEREKAKLFRGAP